MSNKDIEQLVVFAQSDLGFRCALTESTVILAHRNEHRLPRLGMRVSVEIILKLQQPVK